MFSALHRIRSHPTGNQKVCGRRAVLQGLTAAPLSALVLRPGVTSAATTIRVSASGTKVHANVPEDSSAVFQAALNALSSAGGGLLEVAAGVFYLGSPLTYTGGSLTVVGCGQEVSIFVLAHAGTGLTVNFPNPTCCLTVRDIGITPMPGGGVLSAGAIACLLAYQQAGWPNCLIEDVDFGVTVESLGEQNSAYINAIVLQNVWRARIINCNGSANLLQGGTFISFQGECIDSRVIGCTIKGYGLGIIVSSYSEGLHITDASFSGGTVIQTGLTSYNNNTNVNLLGLYISGCQFICSGTTLSLYQVSSGWIQDSYLNGPQPGAEFAAVELMGCGRLKMHNLVFSGQFPGMQNQVGVFATSSARCPTFACQINDCQFENTGTAIVLNQNTCNCYVTNISMYQPGDTALITGPVNLGGGIQQVFLDNSGNTSNTIDCLATSSSPSKATTAYMGYER